MSKTISAVAAARIWAAHHDIEAGRKLLADIAETLKETRHGPAPWDPYERRKRYTLGIPSGIAGERILDLSPKLAAAVIEAHIADKERELVEASIAARVEMESGE